MYQRRARCGRRPQSGGMAQFTSGATILASMLVSDSRYKRRQCNQHTPPHPQTVSPQGAMLWNFTAGSAFYEASPTLSASGMLYIGNNDQYMYALSAATGALVWKYRTQWSYIRSTPVLSLDGSSLFFGSGNGNLYKLLAATGVVQVRLPRLGSACLRTRTCRASPASCAVVNVHGWRRRAGLPGAICRWGHGIRRLRWLQHDRLQHLLWVDHVAVRRRRHHSLRPRYRGGASASWGS